MAINVSSSISDEFPIIQSTCDFHWRHICPRFDQNIKHLEEKIFTKYPHEHEKYIKLTSLRSLMSENLKGLPLSNIGSDTQGEHKSG